MSRVAAGQSLTVNQLVDMEWKFGGMYMHVYTMYIVLEAIATIKPTMYVCVVYNLLIHMHDVVLTDVAVAAGDSDMKKVGNTFLQVKLVLNKGVGTEEVFMGEKFLITRGACRIE